MPTRLVALLTLLAALAAPAAAGAASFDPPVTFGVNGGGVLRFPQAVAYDDGFVYVADQYSFVVQKFTRDGTFVTSWGGYGQGPGRFGATSGDAAATVTSGTVGGISGIAVGPGGDVYVLDSFNSRIEQFTSSGTFKRAFGTPGSAPGEIDTGIHGGIAIFGNLLYLADQDNHRIQRFTLGTDGAPSGVPLVAGTLGSGNGQFRNPQGVAVDPAREHDVFVADDRNHRVQRLNADLGFEQAAGSEGSGPQQFESPYDVGVDPAGHLYVADNENSRVQRLDGATLAFETNWGGFGTAPAQMGFPRSLAALAADDSGGVYVGDTSNDRIDEFSAGGGFIRTWGASGRAPGQFTLPRAVAVDAQGDLVVADTRSDRLQRLRPDGSVIDTFGKLSSLGYPTSGNGPKEFRDLTGVAVDRASGEIWTTEGGNHRVQRFAADGTHLATYGGLAAGDAPGQFTEPLGLATGPGGEVVVADSRNDRLQMRDPATGAWSVQGGFARPAAVAVGADGRRYVAEYGADRVRVVSRAGATLATIGDLDRPEGVAVDGEGRVIVADSGHDRVLRYVPSGDGYALESTLTGFTTPLGVAADAGGSLYVADTYANRIQRFGPPPPAPTTAAAPAAAPPAAAARVSPVRTRPLGLLLRVTPRRDRRPPYRYTVSGRLRRPAGMAAATGCRGRVDVRFGGTRRVLTLRRDCSFRVRLRRVARGRVRVRATFTGNATLAPLAARSVGVRAG
jgi:DNA-binding beta-propeller fold protein YncE